MKMLVGGRPTDARDGATLSVYDPAAARLIDTVPAATKQDIEEALENAEQGAKEWRACPLHRRIAVIRTFLQKFEDAAEELTALLQRETGKTTAAARGCILGSRALGEHYAELARTLGGETFAPDNWAGTENALVMTVREPLGVVVCILPFNFPIDSFMHKVVPALLMGNAVIIKPASETPLTDIRVTELLLESGVPGNAAQIVTGSGAKIGAWLTADARVALINLTGSTRVGIEIAQNAAAHLHRLHLELGGNDPLIILPDADLNTAVEEAFASRIGNAGQVCCAGKRFLIPRDRKEAFLDGLIRRLRAVRVGEPADPQTDCGPLISERAAKELEENLRHCVSQGATLRFGGRRLQGAYFEPTVLEITPEVDAARDLELFGPVWSVLPYDTVDDAIVLANHTMYGLSSGVLGKDLSQMMYVARNIQAGACVIGGSGAYRTSDQPFGGYKMSGLGREGGRYTLEELSQLKTIVLKTPYSF
ncbi:aldehyde dehydrogenase family protein [Butyricicoccus faecihominis]|uniref:aldehyde dehydrogenase family protein n=1 Tax=Butyricicoccus faecihominis TaxID=1712515 RepID=UPI00247A1D81|nr:aldehyde dehydrogenase family protein [Butyricicoccus faecihominis]MCQ5131394.1 aldehyde dehydrogenase family protein [Butyricicoccus faecihominis]